MGWTVTGFRPNRPRPYTEYVDGKPVRKRHEPRKDGYRFVGVLTRSVVGVRKVWNGTPVHGTPTLRFERHEWSQKFALHPTKGYRVASGVTKTSETTKNSRLPKDWHIGVHKHATFTRTRGI